MFAFVSVPPLRTGVHYTKPLNTHGATYARQRVDLQLFHGWDTAGFGSACYRSGVKPARVYTSACAFVTAVGALRCNGIRHRNFILFVVGLPSRFSVSLRNVSIFKTMNTPRRSHKDTSVDE